MNFSPDLLKFNDGSTVACRNCWKKRRQEILDILSREEYGITPEFHGTVSGKLLEEETCCSGHASLKTIEISFPAELGDFAFPIHLVEQKKPGKAPLIVLVNFMDEVYNKYCPVEEIIDHGFNLAIVHYKSVTRDDGDFSDGLAALYTRRGDGTDWGKIGMWAFAASRAVDYLQTLPSVDAENLAIIGHSRLGKTALWCGARDERFRFVISNDSGCAGAAYEREKHENAETVEHITREFPYWFCDNYRKYVGKANEMPFDQHFLLSLAAPRYLLVGSAAGDLWADPASEELSCRAVSPVYRLFDLPGYVAGDNPAQVGDDRSEGTVAYHLRDGVHFLGRADWLAYLEFMEKHLK